MKKLFRLIHWLIPVFYLALAGCGGGGGGGGSSGPQTLVCMGDSQTGDVNYPGTPPWPGIIASMEPEWTVINAGKGNERASTGVSKVGGLLSRHNPDALVIMYGSANTINRDTNRIKEQIRSIIRSGKGSGAKVLVCTIPPMSKGRAGFQSAVDRVNGEIRAVAKEESATLVDIAKEFTGSAATERFPDGLHPDLDGQRIIAMSVREKI
jgi:lysophospholipase L1-like esterase